MLHERSMQAVAMRQREIETWWDDLDTCILAALAEGGKSPRELAGAFGMSEPSMTSLLAMLAVAGRVRISCVEIVPV
jgi:hypothetical protein